MCREYLAPVELLEGQSSPAKLLESCSMTIRRKILLFSALALGAFLAAVYLVSRFALLNGFARLESEAARENIHHLQNGLKNEQSQLEIMARDYAQWDRTYDFMEKGDPDYEREINIVHDAALRAHKYLCGPYAWVNRPDFKCFQGPGGQLDPASNPGKNSGSDPAGVIQ